MMGGLESNLKYHPNDHLNFTLTLTLAETLALTLALILTKIDRLATVFPKGKLHPNSSKFRLNPEGLTYKVRVKG
jgi:hypothetical protein